MKKNKNALDRRKFISLASMATAGISGMASTEVQGRELHQSKARSLRRWFPNGAIR